MARSKPKESGATRAGAAVEDVVLVHGRSEDGKTLAVLRKRGEQLSAGLMTAVEEGKPISGDLVRLVPREGMPFVADVEVLYEHGPQAAGRGDGPAQVSTPAYREGWDSIFGAKARRAHRPADETLN